MKADCSCCGDSFKLVVNVFAVYDYDSDSIDIFDIIHDEYEYRQKKKQVEKAIRDGFPVKGDCLLIAAVYPSETEAWKINLKTLPLDYKKAGSSKILREKYMPRFPRHLEKISDDVLDYLENLCSEEAA